MADLSIRYNALKVEVEKAEEMLTGLEDMPDGPAREKKLDDVSMKLESCRKDFKMVKLEARTLATDDRNQWKVKLKPTEEKLKEISQEIEWSKKRDQSADLNGVNIEKDPSEMTNNDLHAYGRDKMADVNNRAKDTLIAIEQTKETGVETANKLQQQTEQMARVHDDVYQIEDTLERAKVIIKRMIRRTLTDKYIWCLISLLLVAIAVVLVLQYTGNGGTADRDQFSNA